VEYNLIGGCLLQEFFSCSARADLLVDKKWWVNVNPLVAGNSLLPEFATTLMNHVWSPNRRLCCRALEIWNVTLFRMARGTTQTATPFVPWRHSRKNRVSSATCRWTS
jgi:hypothetical protein